MVQHTLTEVPSLCLDMSDKVILDNRTEHRKTLKEIRYVKPLMFLCPEIKHTVSCEKDVRQHTDKLLHLINTQQMGHRYHVFSHPVAYSDKVQKYICQHGLETTTHDGTIWASNCPGTVKALKERKHKGYMYGKVLQCVTDELITTGRWQPGQVGILDDEQESHVQISEVAEVGNWTVIGNWGQHVFYDEISGAVLDTNGVIAARAEDIEEVRKHEVYEKGTCYRMLDTNGTRPNRHEMDRR